jgi:alpha-galactosidase
VDLFREIRTEARKLRPGFRVELCPCGITPTFQLVMTMDQPTDSDPYDEQVTSRTKFLKAMFGPRCPVLQEYVGLPGARSGRGKRIELYPRALGTGQVISTFARTLNESHARWTAVYNRHRPSEGEYLNLYDLRWEPVEGHVIRKAQKFYYGFFTGKPGGAYSGSLELRGLDKQRRYRITDYANDRDLGAVTGPRASITATFEDALLLVAEPLER